MSSQIDLYSGIHKAQRTRFFKISSATGTLDSNSQYALDSLENDLNSLRDHIQLHTDLEETLIHPLLSERVPGGAEKPKEDHRILHKQFNDLLECLREFKKKPKDFKKRQEVSHEFYLAWNRFLSSYFNHINYEEENIMPSLWKLCTSEELANTFKLILAEQKAKDLMDNLGIMLPAMNPSERVMLLSQTRANMPPEIFKGALKRAKSVLNSQEWNSLKTSLKTKD